MTHLVGFALPEAERVPAEQLLCGTLCHRVRKKNIDIQFVFWLPRSFSSLPVYEKQWLQSAEELIRGHSIGNATESHRVPFTETSLLM
jgi:hypothetical protein